MSRYLCAPEGVTVREQWRSAAWMIGGSLVLTLVSLGLQLRIGSNAVSEALLYGALPASLMLAAECGYLKRYSPIARGVLSIGGAAVILVIMLAATLVARMI